MSSKTLPRETPATLAHPAPAAKPPQAAASPAALRERWNPAQAWGAYCGFLDLSLQDFLTIQEHLLLEQIELVSGTHLGRRLLRDHLPRSVSEFRATVPLTTYSHYAPFLRPGSQEALVQGPLAWMQTTGAQADYKYVPYTERGLGRLLDNCMGALILATASRRGDVRISPEATVLYNTPPRPYLSGSVVFGMAERFGLKGVLDPDVSEGLEFKKRVRQGFRAALSKKVDVIISMTSVLVKVGEDFAQAAQARKLDRSMLHPLAMYRLALAYGKSKVLGRPILPKDLWPVKALIGWGIDTPFFREQVRRYWGRVPFEIYACTEGGIMGMQTWLRQGMVFNPYADFYEFIPMDESLRSREDERYEPHTVLLDEVEPDKTYEVVLTNFYGMPFLRYRVGHFVTFLGPKLHHDASLQPQFTFIGRADDRIDLAGFTRLDAKTVWEALARSGLSYESWTLRKEFAGDKPILSMYIELKEAHPLAEVEQTLHASLKGADPFYRDLEEILEIHPLRVTCLPRGTFDRLYDKRQHLGYDLGHLTLPQMNATDDDIRELLASAGG